LTVLSFGLMTSLSDTSDKWVLLTFDDSRAP
jgi:hypothetical protein